VSRSRNPAAGRGRHELVRCSYAIKNPSNPRFLSLLARDCEARTRRRPALRRDKPRD
jgi:hypothetical protein